MELNNSEVYPQIVPMHGHNCIPHSHHCEQDRDVLRVLDIPTRNAIPENRRCEGMWLFVLSDKTLYRLTGGLGNDCWVAHCKDEILPDDLPIASKTQKGVVQIGDNINVNANGLIAVPNASMDTKGVVELATLDEIKKGASGALAISAETLFTILEELRKTINTAQNVMGDFRLFGYRAEELPRGWYICNGGGFDLASPQGMALAALPETFKEDWGVNVDGSIIYKPNLLIGGAVSGQGPFFRPSTGVPGTIIEDAIRNITGHLGFRAVGGLIYRTEAESSGGAFAPSTKELRTFGVSYTSAATACADFDSSRVVPTAAENRPLSVAMTPAIWLGI